MPARQDQTLQIFLIIFIFAFLVTAVVAYLGWRGNSENFAKATALDESLRKKTSESDAQKTELEDTRQLMGFERTATAENVKKQGDLDMKTYGSGIADEASRTYRKVLETVYAELLTSAAREAKQRLISTSKPKRCWPQNRKHKSRLINMTTRGKRQRKTPLRNETRLPNFARIWKRRRA